MALTRTSDLTGESANVNSHKFTADGGKPIEIDLTDAEHAAIMAVLTDHDMTPLAALAAPAPVAPAAPVRRARNRSASANSTDSVDKAKVKAAREWLKAKEIAPADVKTWGRENGHDVKPGPGTLGDSLVTAYTDAHGFEYTAPAAPETGESAPADGEVSPAAA